MMSCTSDPCGAFCYLGHFKKLRIIINNNNNNALFINANEIRSDDSWSHDGRGCT